MKIARNDLDGFMLNGTPDGGWTGFLRFKPERLATALAARDAGETATLYVHAHDADISIGAEGEPDMVAHAIVLGELTEESDGRRRLHFAPAQNR